jgi:hypothetical protein
VIDEGDNGAVDVLELEGLGPVGIDVGYIDAEVARNAGMGKERVGVFKERRDFSRLGMDGARHKEQADSSCCEPGASKDQRRITERPQKVLHFCFSQGFIVRSALIKTAQWPEALANSKDH